MATKRVSEKKLVLSQGGANAAAARKATTSKRNTRSTAYIETTEQSAIEAAGDATGAAASAAVFDPAPATVEAVGAADAASVNASLEAATAEMASLDPASVDAARRHEAIAALAYSYWVARGYQGGSPEADWLRAEQEICHSAEAATV